MADQNKPTSSFLRIAIQLGAGALIGLVGSSVGGPSVISWWYEPPSRDAFSCAGSVKSALSQFVKMQLISAAVGSALVLSAFFFVSRALAKRKSTSSATAP